MKVRRNATLVLTLCAFALALSSPLWAAPPPATIDLRVEDQPLLTLIERIARQCEVGLVAHRGTVETLGEEVSIYAKDAKWADAVDLLRTEYRLELRLTDKRLEVLDADADFRQRLEKRYYPTAQLTTSLDDYPAPHLGLEADDETRGGGGILDFADGPAPLIEDLADLVRNSTGDGVESWERDGVEISNDGRTLSVLHLPSVHDSIEVFLARLERNTARQLICRLHRLPATTTASGVLGARQYRELTRNLTPETSFVVADGQRNHHFTGVVRRYTADAESVEQLFEPVVGLMRTGLMLDVTPHVTRKGVLCNILAAQCSSPRSEGSPIADASGQVMVDIELPAMLYETVADSQLIPQGGGAVYSLGQLRYGVSFEVFEKK